MDDGAVASARLAQDLRRRRSPVVAHVDHHRVEAEEASGAGAVDAPRQRLAGVGGEVAKRPIAAHEHLRRVAVAGGELRCRCGGRAHQPAHGSILRRGARQRRRCCGGGGGGGGGAGDDGRGAPALDGGEGHDGQEQEHAGGHHDGEDLLGRESALQRPRRPRGLKFRWRHQVRHEQGPRLRLLLRPLRRQRQQRRNLVHVGELRSFARRCPHRRAQGPAAPGGALRASGRPRAAVAFRRRRHAYAASAAQRWDRRARQRPAGAPRAGERAQGAPLTSCGGLAGARYASHAVPPLPRPRP
mmetsp:Transcript_25179/g.78997  ORF Transcript_25179/g.78997 Transcript_25179/m.78997 type:complete len:300 (-) Transcript_25179:6-905(-)